MDERTDMTDYFLCKADYICRLVFFLSQMHSDVWMLAYGIVGDLVDE
jgi:hypothetical protein